MAATSSCRRAGANGIPKRSSNGPTMRSARDAFSRKRTTALRHERTKGESMISRRAVMAGLAAAAGPTLTACGSRQVAKRPAYTPPTAAATTPAGLDAVIDISHNVTVDNFVAVRRSNILAVLHKATEGDWVDPSYAYRRSQAEAAGLLWGAYHFGTGQYSGADQAMGFLSAAQPG